MKTTLVSVLLFFSILLFATLFIYTPLNEQNSGVNQVTALGSTGNCGANGDNVTYTFDSTTGALTISGSGAMTDYNSTSSPFYNQTSIKIVIIENGVKSIGDYAFSSCRGLTSITIPDGVTSIGGSAFQSCSKLTSITIPDSVTSIGAGAFRGCTGLTNVTIPSGVTWIDIAMFSGCSNLTSVVISSGVERIMSDAFADCTNLTNIVIPDTVNFIKWDEDTGYAFNGCDKDKLTIIGSRDITKRAFTYAKEYGFNYATAWEITETTHTRTFYGFKDDQNATGTTTGPEQHNVSADGKCSVCGYKSVNIITLKVTTSVNRSFVVYILDSAGQPTKQFVVANGTSISFQVKTTDSFTVQVYETLYSVIKIDGENRLKKTYSSLSGDTTINISISGVMNINNWIMI